MTSTTEEVCSASVLSRLDSGNRTPSNAFPDTPDTTDEDTSTTSKNSLVREASPAESLHDLRPRTQIGSYKETVMPGRAKQRSSAQPANRTISGKTLIDDGPNNDLLQESVDGLDLRWGAQQAPLKDVVAREGLARDDKIERRRSMRISRLVKATESVVQKVSVLGKRGRDAVDAGKAITVNAANKLQRRASQRLRTKEPQLEPVSETKKDGEPPAKRSKVAKEAVAEDGQARSTSRRKTKIWLDHGLYVGQDPGFNPRLTERRNRLNAAARKNNQARPRSILPLPMFAGARLLERGRDFKLPFDVYSPVPPGQPKPEEWRKKSKSECFSNMRPAWFVLVDVSLIKMTRKTSSSVKRRRCGRATNTTSSLGASVRPSPGATIDARIASCSTNVTTATATLVPSTAQIAASRTYAGGTKPGASTTLALMLSRRQTAGTGSAAIARSSRIRSFSSTQARSSPRMSAIEG